MTDVTGVTTSLALAEGSPLPTFISLVGDYPVASVQITGGALSEALKTYNFVYTVTDSITGLTDSSFTFSVTTEVDCATVALQAQADSIIEKTIQHNVDSVAKAVSFDKTAVEDTLSLGTNSPQVCGPLEFKLEYVTPSGLQTTLPSWITFDTNAADFIVVDGASCADAGFHQFTLTAFLTDDPTKELVMGEWLTVELICEESLYKVELDDAEENKPYFDVGTNSSAPIIPDVVLYEGDVKFLVLPEIVDKEKDYPVHVELVGSSDVALFRDTSSKRYGLRFKATWNPALNHQEEEEEPKLLFKHYNLILVDSKAHSNSYNFTLTVLKRESDQNETLSE